MDINKDAVEKYIDRERFKEEFRLSVSKRVFELLKMMREYDEDCLLVRDYATNSDTKYYFTKYARSCELDNISEKELKVGIYETWSYGGYDTVYYVLPTHWLFDLEKATKEFAIKIAHERTRDK